MSFPKPIGVWPLRGTNPTLYTNKAADVIRDKTTGKEYIRGERKIFWNAKEVPKKIEDTEPDRWEFILLTDASPLRIEDYARDIWVSQTFRK